MPRNAPKKPRQHNLRGTPYERVVKEERLWLIKQGRAPTGLGPKGGKERTLQRYSELFRMDLRAAIGKRIAALKARKRPRPVALLDLGMGKGIAAAEIKKAFGKSVFVCGIDFKRHAGKAAIDSVRVGDFDTFRNERFARKGGKQFGGKFDFIFSVFGPTYYSPTPLYSIEKAIGLLAKGGEFFFQVDKHKVTYPQPVREIAKRNGCEIWVGEAGNYYNFRIKKR